MKLLGRLVLAGLVAACVPAAQAQTDWSICADEGSVCRVSGQALVRFGVPGRYSFRVVSQRVICDAVEFGDPAPNQLKQCQVSYRWRDDERYRGWREAGASDAERWRQCADEGELCRLPGAARVRYGSGGRYAYRDANDAIPCNNAVFGDPAPDVAKQCDYQVAGGEGALAWDLCAREGSRCNLRSPTIVRYGANGRYVYREAAHALDCGNDGFGVDPAPDQPKRCEALRLTR